MNIIKLSSVRMMMFLILKKVMKVMKMMDLKEKLLKVVVVGATLHSLKMKKNIISSSRTILILKQKGESLSL